MNSCLRVFGLQYKRIVIHCKYKQERKQTVHFPKKQQFRHEKKLQNIHNYHQSDLHQGANSGIPTAEHPNGHTHFQQPYGAGEWCGIYRTQNFGYDLFMPRHKVEHLAKQAVDEPDEGNGEGEEAVEWHDAKVRAFYR